MPETKPLAGLWKKGRARKTLWLALIMAAVVTTDQYTKHMARTRLASPRSCLHGAVTLTLQHNDGVFLGLGENLPADTRKWLFCLGVGGATLVGLLVLVRIRRINPPDFAAWALILAGSAGNLVDRWVFAGSVTDFIVLAAGPLRTGVFNLADLAITAGVALLLLGQKRSWKKNRSATNGEPE
jgi:signal peptidase II